MILSQYLIGLGFVPQRLPQQKATETKKSVLIGSHLTPPPALIVGSTGTSTAPVPSIGLNADTALAGHDPKNRHSITFERLSSRRGVDSFSQRQLPRLSTRIAELNVGPDRRRLATTDNWWETVLWLTPSIIKS